jgi:hypothetical protein
VGEAMTRYFSSAFHYDFLGTIIRQHDLLGTSTFNGPQ